MNKIIILFFIFLLLCCNYNSGDKNHNSSSKNSNNNETSFNLSYMPIVYILPSKSCSTYWKDNYGDRVFFYVYADLNDYKYDIDLDFQIIKKVYNTVIIILPADDTVQYFDNLDIINDIALKNNLNVIYGIFPNEKYGDEETYLIKESAMNILVHQDMAYMSNLSQTWKIAIWYGWSSKPSDPNDIINFYNNLTVNIKNKYSVWLDEEYSSTINNYADLFPDDLLFITEWYQADNLENVSSYFKKQMIVTGYEQANNADDWLENIKKIIAHIRGKDRFIGIWIFYDKNDGAGEEYSAYFPDQVNILADLSSIF